MQAIGRMGLWVKNKTKTFKLRKLVEYYTKEERFAIVEEWKFKLFHGRHKSTLERLQGNVFIQIYPYYFSETIGEEFQDKKKQYFKLPSIIPDEPKKPLIRPKAIYDNNKSLYSELNEFRATTN